MVKIILFIISLIIIFPSAETQAQQRVSEKEVNIQKIFIDANAAKLLKNYDEAIKLYQSVLDKDRQNSAAAYEISRLYFHQDDLENAFNYINKAIQADSENEWYLRYKATMLSKTSQHEEAAAVYQSLFQQNPSRKEFLSQQIDLFEKAEKWVEAIDVIELAETTFGPSISFYEKKHFFYDKLGKSNKAAEQLELAVELSPEDLDLKHKLAAYFSSLGKAKLAKSVYEEILAINPDDAKANIAMAEDFRNSGDAATYLKSISSIIENEEVEIDLKIKELLPYLEKFIYGKEQNTGDVLELHIKTLCEIHPNDEKAFAMYGDYLNHTGRVEDAIASYQKSISINEGVYQVWEQLLWLLKKSGNTKDFFQISEEALDIFPNNGGLYFLHGLALHDLGRADEALSVLRQAFLMSGKNIKLKTDIHQLRAQIYHQKGDTEKAVASFDKAVKADESNPFLKEQFARYLAYNNTSMDRALQLIQTANKIAADQYRIEATTALIYFKQNEFEDALKWINKSLNNGGDKFHEILDLAGDIHIVNGKIDPALAFWKQAIEKGGNAQIISEKINQKKLVDN